ncbi:uncharacterized protein B0H18DRAFT_1015291 [Fomitopsis serialis]|uniref:uncharacterized protein n=1 Tax=Fomitopsis serialis TaxID=139415 RepID=UPI002008DE89|nr:uncharacterized protein B0H18DRAFT_1015291 [Neoantrodia serialis]KAH9923336.1 hypothetical protein B0H18DRAFT_1015291 [Neoantrodia serialis]
MPSSGFSFASVCVCHLAQLVASDRQPEISSVCPRARPLARSNACPPIHMLSCTFARSPIPLLTYPCAEQLGGTHPYE